MIAEGTPSWRSNINLHSVGNTRLPLGVTCACGRKTAVPLHRLGQLEGNMHNVKTLKLKCQACGSRDWKAALFITMREVEDFIGRPLTDEELVP